MHSSIQFLTWTVFESFFVICFIAFLCASIVTLIMCGVSIYIKIVFPGYDYGWADFKLLHLLFLYSYFLGF